MKVLHFLMSTDRRLGGVSSYMASLAGVLNDKCDLTIVSGGDNHVRIDGVQFISMDLSLKRLPTLSARYRRLLADINPDIVHINGIWMPQIWLFQREVCRSCVPMVLSPHGMLEDYILSRHPLKKKLALWLYQRRGVQMADYLHVTAESELMQLRRLGYLQSSCVIPNGVDLQGIPRRSKWRTSTSLTILFLSRIHPKKGVEFLIEALSKLQNAPIRVIIAGEGDDAYVRKLRRLCSEKEVDEKVTFTGGVYGDEKWKLFHESDVFVLPTYSENFGIVVAEALAVGNPVITTKGTPWQELEECKCGWWIDLSVDHLTLALEDALVKSSAELADMGKCGMRLMEKKYDIEIIGQRMMAFYEDIIT